MWSLCSLPIAILVLETWGVARPILPRIGTWPGRITSSNSMSKRALFSPPLHLLAAAAKPGGAGPEPPWRALPAGNKGSKAVWPSALRPGNGPKRAGRLTIWRRTGGNGPVAVPVALLPFHSDARQGQIYNLGYCTLSNASQGMTSRGDAGSTESRGKVNTVELRTARQRQYWTAFSPARSFSVSESHPGVAILSVTT